MMTVVFDIETSHQSLDAARIVELSYRILNSELEVVSSRDELAYHDGMTIDPDCAAVHGICVEDCLTHGRHVRDVLGDMVQDWKHHGVGTLVSHGVDVDVAILASDCFRHLGAWPFMHCSLVCTKELGAIACCIPRPGSVYKWPSLAELWNAIVGSPGDPHRAVTHRSGDDTDMCVECYRILVANMHLA